ncbi:unnamed protein product [Nesidiocoris tenuis]|uniref:Uncharacterized protein n=1 Tax=Nesidiocoris tenuis TaxID=355587 RepID=A0A6H5HF26_9HEMI|nr:unnamed protein product [Nesidiocoris tenuis]CAB0015630.1 unnamed protein product [Nesidiocoris tenuis]
MIFSAPRHRYTTNSCFSHLKIPLFTIYAISSTHFRYKITSPALDESRAEQRSNEKSSNILTKRLQCPWAWAQDSRCLTPDSTIGCLPHAEHSQILCMLESIY